MKHERYCCGCCGGPLKGQLLPCTVELGGREIRFMLCGHCADKLDAAGPAERSQLFGRVEQRLLGSLPIFQGLSTDNKPAAPAIGAKFIETDTGDMYLFTNAGAWLQVGALTTSTAQVVV